ncbi:hypothetical protein EHS25_000934 [Saitozyma podzolica]|uniref:Uncharacterized protein n=1 Tax=Saitozyma podzolica TaxID=1890683 RepID=A0A427YXP1_9TREE|nr:hypothetical protein EHS25_000934 [Saitozyma podzolica]
MTWNDLFLQSQLQQKLDNTLKALKWDEEGFIDRDDNVTKLHPNERRGVEFRERFRTWFNHAPWSSIKKHNVLVWLSWSCFNLPLEDAAPTTSGPPSSIGPPRRGHTLSNG